MVFHLHGLCIFDFNRTHTSICRLPTSRLGDLFRAAGDHHFNMSTVSSAFPIFNHPAFGLYTTSSGHSEFGGLGSLGMSAALAAHSQLGAFPGMGTFPGRVALSSILYKVDTLS